MVPGNMNTFRWRLTPIAVILLLLQACDSITERDEDVTVNLDSFNLVGGQSQGLARATVTGNPACTAAPITLNSLLTSAENYDDFDEYLESIDINSVRYRITQNSTAVESNGTFQMTDPATGQLTTVASVSIPANTTSATYAPLPFVDNGRTILQHYMDNLDATFSYCAEGSPDTSELNMTMDLQLNMTVTIDIL